MARSRFIEIRSGEKWRTVSNLFADWVQANGTTDSFGWSEGDTLHLPDGTDLACFHMPDKHGQKVEWFERWAETTDRLYGIASGLTVHFPRKPELSALLPQPPQTPLPPWLSGA